MLSTISFIFFGVGEVNFITAKETIKFNIMATLPNPSGEIPNQ